MKRTQNEILKRIEEVKSYDFLGFERNDYIDFLDFEHAKIFLKDGTKKEDWEGGENPRPFTDPIKDMKEYMDFAWEKANGCRGISANRRCEWIVRVSKKVSKPTPPVRGFLIF